VSISVQWLQQLPEISHLLDTLGAKTHTDVGSVQTQGRGIGSHSSGMALYVYMISILL
jgi:hypothetical protein